ncbi:polysaccharide deacetylase family protein [Clostridium tepidum]|jgi:peptidoglycan/xylan/chitin deacetylase (PgdA/CDA1 family)|uniref:Polysaccharide deacetylase n=1 Tax=Clostridium tepidum TaxID=1962263 RepID=A0A1S9I2K0_9CLOT|nr:polysaccharide deacetylase family protein [Clostridium tepidum]MCR1933725.1 polysaccharide deacetylase [Clostridium tepidum]MDU6876750.1 polysaccharide deacetylase family protein [Clostridium botulinum]OOO63663.1 polysaccharide deacetylase [Clostridium tepidum]OOO64536.1 polysaccharide deacetylase [Clostridium tepidum]
MRNSRKNIYTRRKQYDLRNMVTICLLFFSIISTLITGGRLLKVKIENNMLAKKINNISSENKNIKDENLKLMSDIDKENETYKQKMKNIKIAYLTFDDGPSKNTKEILKILKENDVKATFFVNGHPGLEDLYKDIAKDGHVIANHTYSHDYKKIYISPENFEKDIKKLDKYIEETVGQKPSHIIRYPGGSNNTISHNYGGPNIMKQIINHMNELGYMHFDWNVDSTDASAFCQKKDKIINSVLTESRGLHKAVILMHDTNPKTTTVQALPEIIKGLKEQGFVFDVITKDTPKTSFTR